MSDAIDPAAGRLSYQELEALVVELRALVASQQVVIAELQTQLRGNSRNSSRPPSSDGLQKPSVEEQKKEKQQRGKDRSLRKRSGRKPGAEPGHPGARLDPVAVPDGCVEHPPDCCEECGRDLSGAGSVAGGESRQVFDVPERVALRVIEHVVTCRECECGHVSEGSFPAGVDVVTQYGPRVRALGVYLIVFQHLPYDRARQALRDLAGADVSTGTLVGWVTAAAEGLGDFDQRLRELLVGSPVCHFDETGARIAGRLGWVHVASTETLTRYSSYDGDGKRGQNAIDDAGVLPDFRGIAVHDGWAPYRNYTHCEHALCNIHHLRELRAATEACHLWPVAMSCLLLDTKTLVARATSAGKDRLSARALRELTASYEAIIQMGHEEHPATTGKKTKAHNLLLRLEQYRSDVLRFAHDFTVPFGNNQGEQDIRMIKLQQKISGCWRTHHGALKFLTIRSYLSTARKHGHRPLNVLDQLTAGRPWLPDPAPA